MCIGLIYREARSRSHAFTFTCHLPTWTITLSRIMICLHRDYHIFAHDREYSHFQCFAIIESLDDVGTCTNVR